MRDFYFLRISQYLTKDRISILQHKSKTEKGFEILEKWIRLNKSILYKTSLSDGSIQSYSNAMSCYDRLKNHVKSMKSRFDLPEGVDEKCASLLDPSTIQEAYIRTKKLICDGSRTGEVYKVWINCRYYVIKIAVKTPTNEMIELDQLIKELKQEAEVYKRLSFL